MFHGNLLSKGSIKLEGKLVMEEFLLGLLQKFLPSMTEKYQIGSEPSGEDVELFWKVEEQLHFENVGFSKTVNGEKFLICADCERGPIGWTQLSQPQSYVAIDRVKYAKT